VEGRDSMMSELEMKVLCISLVRRGGFILIAISAREWRNGIKGNILHLK
jgi:hypothetical protein